MEINFRKLVRSSAVFSVLGMLPSLSRVLLMPLFLLFLSPYNYGIIGLNGTLASALPIFLTLGYNNSFMRYFFDYQRNKKILYAYVSTIMVMTLVISVLLIVITIPLGQKIHTVAFKDPVFTYYPYGITAIVMAMIFSLNGIQLMFYRNLQRITSYLWLAGGIFIVSTIAESFAILVFRFDAAGIILMKVGGILLVSIISWISLIREMGTISFDFRFLKSSFRYSVYLIPYIFFGFIYTSYDRVMIEKYLDFNALAVFNLSMAIVMFVEMGIGAIQNAIYPSVYEMFKNDPKVHEESINKIFRFMGMVIMIIVGGLCAATPIGIDFLKPVYRTAIYLVPVLLISYLFRYLWVVYTVPLFYYKKQVKKLPLLNFIGGCITVGVNFMLLPTLGLLGAAIAAVCVRLVLYLCTYYLVIGSSDFKFDLSYVWVIFLVVSLLLTGLFASDYFFHLPPLLFKGFSFMPLLFVMMFYIRKLKLLSLKGVGELLKINTYMWRI